MSLGVVVQTNWAAAGALLASSMSRATMPAMPKSPRAAPGEGN
jgi:hypothetical protein